MSKLSVFLIRLATDPEVRDLYRNPKTRAQLIKEFAKQEALGEDDIDALNRSDVSSILGEIAASNQQTDGTEVRLPRAKKRK